jgi:CofH/MqnC C-terminal region
MSDEWLGVMDTAHRLGLASTATMMFGHVETVAERIEHLERVRTQQDRSRGFTAFIAWTFQAEHTKLKAPTVGAHEYLRTQALARIYLDNIPNIQSSWVTQGQDIGQVAEVWRERSRQQHDRGERRLAGRHDLPHGRRRHATAHPRSRVRAASTRQLVPPVELSLNAAARRQPGSAAQRHR